LGEEEVAQAKIVENSCTILIVDDSERVPPALENLLHDDFSVQGATNRDEALELAKANSFPIIVIDLDIPGEDTFELAEDLREQQPEARVIGLYPRKMRYPSIRYSEEGFDGFLVKPFVQQQVDAVTNPEDSSDEDPGFLLRSDSLLQALKYNPKDGEVEEYYDALAVQMTDALNELGAECAEEVILDLRFLPDNPKRDELLQNCSSLCEEVCIEPKVIGNPAIQPVFPDGTPFFKSLKALLEA
jgi:CheY-like chemotaxis protein